MNDAENDGNQKSKAANGRDAEQPVIVAIGASAGGIQALQDFFAATPADTGAAYVVVVHLDPERHSHLASVLAKRAKIPVEQVGDKAKPQKNHIYVIPPDRRLRMIDHEIEASEFDEPRGQRSPIDGFFRSMADRLGDGIAIVLSGSGSDGTIGVRAVKEAGGIILVQEPAEAEFGSMPRSAIATGVVDFVLPVQQLAERVVELVRMKISESVADAQSFDEELVRRVLAHLRVRTGHDFSKYKRSTVLRRIARRMQVSRTDNLKDYYEHLRANGDEAQALMADLLISVTTFFRDKDAFEGLRTQVIPAIFEDVDSGEPIRVWVSGCATGEEAYSIAILLLEEAGRHDLRPPLQIFASDLDARALAIAREGRYPTAIEGDVSEERLRRYFAREGDHYRVRQELRDITLFAVHDLLKDPPFSHVDLISCRNVMIYLDRELQEQVCSTFHYALNPRGYLLLGSSELAEQPTGLFRAIDRGARLYQSTAHPGDKPRILPRLLTPPRVRESAAPAIRSMTPATALSEATLHRRAIEKVAPPSILVDDAHRLVHLSDNAGRYLMPSGGPMTGDAVDLARPELRFEMRSSLHRAFEQNQSTLSLPISVRFNGAPHRVFIFVKPADVTGPQEFRHALVMFIEGEAIDESAVSVDRYTTDETVRRLTQELELTQSRLRTMREESDAANEELRAANEELQSINEEYRSTSEELETSREELQSINEELQTVNSELKLKLEAISRAHSDLQNLMAATDIGTLFLDANLRIKRFTDQVTELFSLTVSDEGRPITDFAHQLRYEDLIKDARRVLSELTPVRREAAARNGHWYDVRMRPYRTVDDKIDGVVITFLDVSDRRKVEEALRSSEQHLRQEMRLVELSREPIFVWDFDGGIVEWNRGCEELYGYKREEALGQRKDRLLTTSVPGSSFDQLKVALLDNGSWSGELEQQTKDGRKVMVESRIELVTIDGRRLVLESARNITERKQWEQRQKLLLAELTHRVKNTLTVVQAIAHQTMRNSPTVEEFTVRFDGRLAALATAHTLMVESEWKGADLAAMARQQLQSHMDAERVHIEGPPVLLSADLATPFGLVLHELATNAAKYGSLSQPQGLVNLTWTLGRRNNDRIVNVIWQERGGPPPPRRKPAGFGTALIQNAIPGATVTQEFMAEGQVCTIVFALGQQRDD